MYALTLELATASDLSRNVDIKWKNNGRKPVKIVIKSKMFHLPYYLEWNQTHLTVIEPNEAYMGLIDKIELHWEDGGMDLFKVEKDSFIDEQEGDQLLHKAIHLDRLSTFKTNTEYKARL